MRLQSIDITNFRGIRQLKIDFRDHLNVFVGENGAGKSSVLDAVAMTLSWFTARIRKPGASGLLIKEDDITSTARETSVAVVAQLNDLDRAWTLAGTRPGRVKEIASDYDQLREIVTSIQRDMEADPKTSIPLMVHYPVNRTVLDIPLRIREKHSFAQQIDAYENALTGARSNFRLFFEWFREREDLENELSLFREDGYRPPGGYSLEDAQLKSVRSAIESVMPGYADLRIRRQPHRMVLRKGTEILAVNQLSDGEKCLLALVGDLARRLAIANPGMNNALEGSGVVLIDEIDLHLHPAWQRMIIPALRRTFPNCQFLLTTHSPQVLGHVEPEDVFLLKMNDQGVVQSKPDDTYGQESGRILEDLMGVPARPQEVKDRLHHLFKEIREGRLDSARNLVDDIEQKIGSDPELDKAKILIHRKETVGK